MGTFLKKGLTALHYLEQKRYGRKKAELSEEEKMLIQEDLEKNWSLDVIKGTFSATISCSMRFFTTWEIGVLSQKKSFLGRKKERPMGTRKKWERSFLP